MLLPGKQSSIRGKGEPQLETTDAEQVEGKQRLQPQAQQLEKSRQEQRSMIVYRTTDEIVHRDSPQGKDNLALSHDPIREMQHIAVLREMIRAAVT